MSNQLHARLVGTVILEWGSQIATGHLRESSLARERPLPLGLAGRVIAHLHGAAQATISVFLSAVTITTVACRVGLTRESSQVCRGNRIGHNCAAHILAGANFAPCLVIFGAPVTMIYFGQRHCSHRRLCLVAIVVVATIVAVWLRIAAYCNKLAGGERRGHFVRSFDWLDLLEDHLMATTFSLAFFLTHPIQLLIVAFWLI